MVLFPFCQGEKKGKSHTYTHREIITRYRVSQSNIELHKQSNNLIYTIHTKLSSHINKLHRDMHNTIIIHEAFIILTILIDVIVCSS